MTDGISRLGATKAVIVGGAGAVSGAVFEQLLGQLGPGKVDRLAGLNRYDTAALVAARIKAIHPSLDGTVFVATGLDYPDALAAGPDAWKNSRPILLVKGGVVPTETLAAVTALGSTREVVLGGTGVVPDSAAATIQDALVGRAPFVRLGGVNRYDTAAIVADWSAPGEGLGWVELGIAAGQDFADALSGGPVMGKAGGVLLLTKTNLLPSQTSAALTAHKASVMNVLFLGGTGAVSSAVRNQILDDLQ